MMTESCPCQSHQHLLISYQTFSLRILTDISSDCSDNFISCSWRDCCNLSSSCVSLISFSSVAIKGGIPILCVCVCVCVNNKIFINVNTSCLVEQANEIAVNYTGAYAGWWNRAKSSKHVFQIIQLTWHLLAWLPSIYVNKSDSRSDYSSLQTLLKFPNDPAQANAGSLTTYAPLNSKFKV